jgi:hypothetical protein
MEARTPSAAAKARRLAPVTRQGRFVRFLAPFIAVITFGWSIGLPSGNNGQGSIERSLSGLSAGGRRIRTLGPSRDGVAFVRARQGEEVSAESTYLAGGVLQLLIAQLRRHIVLLGQR